MSWGFETYDAAGNVHISIADRMPKLTASITVSIGQGTTDVPISGVADDGTWSICILTPVDEVAAYLMSGAVRLVSNQPYTQTISFILVRL